MGTSDSVDIAGEDSPVRVLISYSHDSEAHADKVLALSDQLRTMALIVELINTLRIRRRDGRVWMEQQIEKADFVLCVCTEGIQTDDLMESKQGTGRGVSWEANLIRNALYKTPQENSKFFAVLFDENGAAFIPECMEQSPQFTAQIQSIDSPGYEQALSTADDQRETPISS